MNLNYNKLFMKSLFTTTLFTLFTIILFGQQNLDLEAQKITDEGKLLYESEMASWYGTDIFLEMYGERNNIGGYFSYTENGIPKCIFFSRKENPKVIGTIAFDSTYSVNTAKPDISEREFTSYELDMYKIRKKTFEALNSDTLFKAYNNTSLNVIPIINNGTKKAYILTGPKTNGLVS